MTADVELLPLPEALFETGSRRDLFNVAQMEGYARAVAEHNVSRERDRAERLAETLRGQRDWWLASKGEAVSNAPGGLTRIDPGFISLCDAHVQQIDLALRDHDQEGKDG